MKCLECNQIQCIAKQCSNCKIELEYDFCKKCNSIVERDTRFHCDKCNNCYYKAKEELFHCDKCEQCYLARMKDNHGICIRGKFKKPCPICLES